MAMAEPVEEWEDDHGGWLCDCGDWMDHSFHCDTCGAEPPWGCPGDCCDGSWDDEPDDYEDGEYPHGGETERPF